MLSLHPEAECQIPNESGRTSESYLRPKQHNDMRNQPRVRGLAATWLSTIGIGPDERRRAPASQSRCARPKFTGALLESHRARGLRGVEYVVSGKSRRAARRTHRADLGDATWERCQFHLARTADSHAPTLAPVPTRPNRSSIDKTVPSRRLPYCVSNPWSDSSITQLRVNSIAKT